METLRIAVFDVCGTITKTNNTSDFICFVLRSDRSWRYGLFVLIRLLSSLFHLLGIRALGGRDWLRDGQIALLRGYSCARLRELSEGYVRDLLAEDRLNRRILDAIQREKDQRRTVWLVSSAIDPPIAEIAKRLEIQHCFSSELEIEHEHCTGRLKTDLLGHKELVWEKLPAPVNWQDSSVYSDNPEDVGFMERFGRRIVVLNAGAMKRMWERGKGEFEFLVNDVETAVDKDVESVNERTVKWIYVPPLCYIISRCHRHGVLTLLSRELVPVTGASFLFTDVGAWSFLLMPLSLWMFYGVYETGALFNDLAAGREAPETGRTGRIAPEVHLHVGLFLALRLALVGLGLGLLAITGYPAWLYAGALVTFAFLKICRSFIPLLLVTSRVPLPTLLGLGAIFFVLDAPWRIYAYCRSRGLALTGRPVRQVRCANTMVLCALGAVLYHRVGWPHVLVIASYYLVLDCAWLVRRKEPSR
jgi:phosphoserine phosphatase